MLWGVFDEGFFCGLRRWLGSRNPVALAYWEALNFAIAFPACGSKLFACPEWHLQDGLDCLKRNERRIRVLLRQISNNDVYILYITSRDLSTSESLNSSERKRHLLRYAFGQNTTTPHPESIYPVALERGFIHPRIDTTLQNQLLLAVNLSSNPVVFRQRGRH